MGYKILGVRGARVSAAIVPLLEIYSGFGLAIGAHPAVFSGLLLVQLAVYSGAILHAVGRGVDADCGCFGDSKKVSPRLLLRNAVLAGLILVALWLPVSHTADYPWTVGVSFALLFGGWAVYNYRLLGN